MSTGLVLLDLNSLPSTAIGTDDQLRELTKSSFLGRLQLYSKNAQVTKGLIGAGHFGIPETGDSVIDLGTSVDLLVFDKKPKAMDMRDKQAIITSYDPSSDDFQRIQAIADGPGQNKKCMYGVTFLVYERTTCRFLEFYCGTASTRPEAGKILPYIPSQANNFSADALTLGAAFVERGSFSWHVPVVKPCSTAFDVLPSSEQVIRQINKFRTLKAEVEVVQDDGRKARAR